MHCPNTPRVLGVALAALAWIAIPAPLLAQDPFEIEVYGYETAGRGEWELESHLNYTARGTTAYDGPIAPTEHQTHLALELTRGLTNHWEVAAYLLAAYRPGTGVEYAGWRVRSRVRAPETWHLPLDLAIGAEFEFPPAPYDENSVGLEIRPIVAKRIGRIDLRFNPIVERGLRGRDTTSASGWEFKPCARVAATLTPRIALGVEYYGKTALWGIKLPSSEHVHQLFPTVDWTLGDDLVLSANVGFGTTAAGNRLVFNTRLEVPLGK